MQWGLVAEAPIFGLAFRDVLVPALLVTTLLVGLVALFAYATNRGNLQARRRTWISRACYAGLIATIVVLALTSFGAILSVGHLQHYALLAHLAAAGAFAFLLLAVAIAYLPRSGRGWWLESWSAWCLIIAGMASAGTMFYSMLPQLDTGGLNQFAELHRFAGLFTALSAAVHLLALAVERLGWR